MYAHILCIDDNNEFLFNLRASLKYKYQVSTAINYELAAQVITQNPVDLVFLDVKLGEGESGIRLIQKMKELDPSLVIIMLSAFKNADLIVHAIKEGASDYLCKPYPFEDLITVIERNLAKKIIQDKNAAFIEYCNDNTKPHQIIGKAPALLDLLQQAEKLKGHFANVLIEGDCGTGKEMLARYLHAIEDNPKRPFIAINCAAIPDTLIETELFGHERGSFTGAVQRKIGKCELAHNGDLFLDEIDSVKPEFQAKFLRVLQEKEFYRVGGIQPIKVNFRVIVATNKDLSKLVLTGQFRQDLLYRLRVIFLKVPSLSERTADIADLANYFINKHARTPKVLSQEVLACLQNYSWPGNIRELENLIQSLVISSPANVIQPSDLPQWFAQNSALDETVPREEAVPATRQTSLSCQQINKTLKDYLLEVEKNYIDRALKAHRGNITHTAKVLGISRTTLYHRFHDKEVV